MAESRVVLDSRQRMCPAGQYVVGLAHPCLTPSNGCAQRASMWSVWHIAASHKPPALAAPEATGYIERVQKLILVGTSV